MCIYVCTHVCMCVCMYVRTFVCMYICTYVYMYIYIYICTYVCVYEINRPVPLILEYFIRLNFGNLSHRFQFQRTDTEVRFTFICV